MQRNRMIWTCVLLVCGMLAACVSSPPPPPATVELTFQHRTPIRIVASGVEVVDRYEPSGRPPYVEHLHSPTPSALVRRWAEERLTMVGTQGLVTLIIDQASVVEQPLPVTDGLEGLFSDEPDTKLIGRIEARFEYVNVGPPQRTHAVEITADASIEVLESATLNERDLAYLRLVELLASEFDQALTAEIEANLGDILR